jgi:PIN domain nuclease of toxin-antitoxin system
MAKAVLDASALLAHLRGEEGSEAVEAVAGAALISAVNFAEVISKLVERQMPADIALFAVSRYGLEVAPYDEALAGRTGALRAQTRQFGLSLGDRACLALAEQAGLPALTADREWAKLKLSIDIRVIR